MSKCPFCEVSCGNDHCSYAPVKVEYPSIMILGSNIFYQNYESISDLCYNGDEVETIIQDEQVYTLGVF